MWFMWILALIASLLTPLAASPSPAAAADCQFVLGFKTLHDLIPEVVGDCRANERHNPLSGDGLQETTRGLLVWRRADNFTAFTDGYRTWINGPHGVQVRLNTERFPWESDPLGVQVLAVGFGQSGTAAGYAIVLRNPNQRFAIVDTGVDVTAYDAAGRALATQSGVVGLLLPEQRRGIASQMDLPEGASVARVDAQIKPGTSAQFAPQETFRAEGVSIVSGPGQTRATGVVVSPYPRNVTTVYVGAVAYDAKGAIIGGGSTYVASVPARGRAQVEVAITAAGQPARVELYPALTGLSRFE